MIHYWDISLMQHAAPPVKRFMKEHWPAFHLVVVFCWEKRPLRRLDGCLLGIVALTGLAAAFRQFEAPHQRGKKKKNKTIKENPKIAEEQK